MIKREKELLAKAETKLEKDKLVKAEKDKSPPRIEKDLAARLLKKLSMSERARMLRSHTIEII